MTQATKQNLYLSPLFHVASVKQSNHDVFVTFAPEGNETTDFDEAEREWCEAFDSDEGFAFTDDEDAGISDDGYDEGDDGVHDGSVEDDRNLMEDFNFSATTEDY